MQRFAGRSSAVMTVIGLLMAYGCSSKPTARTPAPHLPDDKKPVATATEPKAPAPKVEAPAAPPPPIDVTLAAPKVTVKLIGKGKGKLAKLALTPKQGATQATELAIDFSTIEDGKGTVLPTVVLVGDTEVKAVDAGGTGEVIFTVGSVDVRNGTAEMPAEKFKQVLVSLPGMTIAGTIGANGTRGNVAFHVGKPDQFTPQALQLVGLSWPTFPAFPDEPIGVGAKWQTSSTLKLADKVEVTQVTDYELVSHTGANWAFKAKTKVTGTEQAVEGGKISNISGSGDLEGTVTEGVPVPTFKSKVTTKFTATEKDKSVTFELGMGAAVTAKGETVTKK